VDITTQYLLIMLSSLIVESRRLWIKFRNYMKYVFALMDNDTRFLLARNIKIQNLTMMQENYSRRKRIISSKIEVLFHIRK
jgi:hypothetical protein